MAQQAAVDRDLPWRRLSLLAALAFLWPALVNGMPFLFYDTPGYLGGANALAHGLFGGPLDWKAAPVMLGRSIYYGSFLYGSLAVAGFWPAAILQAAFGSLARDPAFRAETNRVAKIEPSYVPGPEMDAAIKQILTQPKEVSDRVIGLLSGK